MNIRNEYSVSIVIPCYNQGVFLREAILSVKNTQIPAELIIVNDGSTDPFTLDTFSELESEGIRIIHQSNKGLSAARNTGIGASSAAIVLALDADNKATPQYIDQAVEILLTNPSVGIVYSDFTFFGEKEGVQSVGEFSISRLLTGNYIDACAIFRKKVWEDVGGYDENLPFSFYEDWDFWIGAAEKDWAFYYLPEPLFYYRVRSGSMVSAALDPEKRKAVTQYVANKHSELYRLYTARIFSTLHSNVADWEANIASFKAQLQKEYDEHRRVTEAAFASEFKILEENFRKEQARTVSDFETHISNLQEGFVAERMTLEQHFIEETKGLHSRQHAREVELHGQFEAERNRLDVLLEQVSGELAIQKTHSSHLGELVQQYERRIEAIENSRLWKLRRNYYKMRSLLKSSGGKKKRLPVFGFFKRIVFFLSRKGRLILRRFFKKIFRTLYLWLEEIPVRIVPVNELQLFSYGGDTYHQWMARNFPRETEFRQYKKECEQFEYKPKVSILLPVYNPPVGMFRQTLNSVLGQIYENWELCIADDASTDEEVKSIIEEYRESDYRIKVVYREENGHISRASNSALELASGEFALLLDHDDLLTSDCLYHVTKLLNQKKGTDLIYSDEDKIDEKGVHSAPHFKPKWCPDNFLSRNYLGHVVVCRTSILREIGGFRVGFEGSQDYDMLLRFTERTDKIEHIPHVLYHWRIHAGSASSGEEAKPYAYHAAQKALTESLIRRNEEATVGFLPGFRGYSLRYKLSEPGKISIIIPTKDNTDVLKTCIDSVYEKSTWDNFEVIVVSNNSTDKKLFRLLDDYSKKYSGKFRFFEQNVPFNFSALMNFGAKKATGEYFLLLNNDTEVIAPDWMEAMMEQAQRKSVGAVGVKLLYHNDTIQHAGVIVGLGGVAGHTFVGEHKDSAGYFNFIQSISNYSAVTAACLMVSRRKYNAVNGFDEKFEVEYNDVDFCLRLMEAGYHNVYLPHVELYHYESLTRGHPHMSKESYERHIKELTFFKDRWETFIEDDPCYSIHLTRGAHNFAIAL